MRGNTDGDTCPAVSYACRDGWDSLRPVPPGSSRREYYCPHCLAERCLFNGELVVDRQRRGAAEELVTAIGFASGLGIAGKGTIYRYIREGLPAERQPHDGDKMVWCVRPAAARSWLLDHGPERLMRVIMDEGRC